MRALVVLALCAAASTAHARVTVDVQTADAAHAWQAGHATPFTVRVRGIWRAVRVDCHGSANSYVRAQIVTNDVVTALVADHPPRAIPAAEEIQCTVYSGDSYVAGWSGTLAWPKTTLPDNRITKLAARRCGAGWCVDAELDRSHLGSRAAELELLCTLRHASQDPFFAVMAPSSREQVTTLSEQVRLKLPDAAGATVIRCSVDRGRYGHSRYADPDPTNNEAEVIVANRASTQAQLELVSIGRAARIDPGCGTCSTFIPGSISVTAKLRNRGRDAVAGAGVHCTALGTSIELRGATGPLAAGDAIDVEVSIQRSSAVMQKLAGTLPVQCEAVLWDQKAASPIRTTATVEFAKSP